MIAFLLALLLVWALWSFITWIGVGFFLLGLLMILSSMGV